MENLKNVAPIEDFNWDAYENGETVTNVSHEDLEKAYDNTLNKVNDREVVDGTVIAMNKREVVVNIGYKYLCTEDDDYKYYQTLGLKLIHRG